MGHRTIEIAGKAGKGSARQKEGGGLIEGEGVPRRAGSPSSIWGRTDALSGTPCSAAPAWSASGGTLPFEVGWLVGWLGTPSDRLRALLIHPGCEQGLSSLTRGN